MLIQETLADQETFLLLPQLCCLIYLWKRDFFYSGFFKNQKSSI